MKLKVMSFNTQHCSNFKTQQIDFDIMADTIRTLGADIVGLNEIYGEGDHSRNFYDQVGILGEKLGFYSYFAKAIDVFPDAPTPYGNALLSRYPILHAETVPVPDAERTHEGWYETRCLLNATVDIGGELTVCVIHFGLEPEEKEHAVNTVLSRIRDRRCVLMGDFNLTPESEHLLPIRERMYDTAVLFDKEKLSWPSDVPERKIDYLFTSRDIRVLSADIPEIVASDHRPYVAEIEV